MGIEDAILSESSSFDENSAYLKKVLGLPTLTSFTRSKRPSSIILHSSFSYFATLSPKFSVSHEMGLEPEFTIKDLAIVLYKVC